ncbi:choice-of-anchor D domain-containing protein, partial [Candidatus Latescibacterota bacterium]
MRKFFILSFVLSLISTFSFAVVFAPTPMRLTGEDNVQYAFDGSTLNVPVTVTGTPAFLRFFVFTKGKANEIIDVKNGFLGWHYMNKIDTCIYQSGDYKFTPGSNTVTWDGRDNDGGIVPPDEYTYYLWGFDDQSPRAKAVPAYVVGNEYGDRCREQFLEYDEQGYPLATPVWKHRYFRWIMGSDPEDRNLFETSSFDFGDGWGHGGFGQWIIEPDDWSTVYTHAFNSETTTAGVYRFNWVPNDAAVKDDDYEPVYFSTLNNYITAETDNNFIYIGESNYKETVIRTYVHIIDHKNDEYVGYIDQSEVWESVDDYSQGGLMNGGYTLMTYTPSTGLMVGGNHCCCLRAAFDPLSWFDDEEDTIRWENGNGDYSAWDNNYEVTSERPWVCNALGATRSNHAMTSDTNGFINTGKLQGAMSFEVGAPDGTGIGQFSYAGEIDAMKGGGIICDTGSAYDGVYVPKTGEGNAGRWFVARDSFKGTITTGGSSTLEPEISLSAFSVNIGDVNVGSSGTGTFTITNDGNKTLTVHSINCQNTVFTVSPSSASVAVGQSLTVTITFNPVDHGEKSTVIYVESDDSDEGSLTVNVSGTGLAPEISLSSTTIILGVVNVESSVNGMFTITNSGNKTLTIQSITSNNTAFTVNPSSASIPSGQNQTITVTFTPTERGVQGAFITVLSNDSDEGTLTLNASGTGKAPEIVLSAFSVNIGNVDVGSSGTGTFTITNEGNITLTVNSINCPNTVFSVSPSSASVAVGQSLTVTITFNPVERGEKSTVIYVESDDSDEGSLTVNISGTGLAPEIVLSAFSMNIGDVDVESSGTGTFTITNEGNKTLTVHSINCPNTVFSVSPSSASVAVGQSLTVTITFNPSERGEQSTVIYVESDDTDESSLNVNVSGTGIEPEISLLNTSLSLGDVNVGSSISGTFTITNEGNKDLTVNNISSDHGDFSVSPSSVTIPPGDHRDVTVTFTPVYINEQWANITVESNDRDENSLNVSVRGNGKAPEISLSTGDVDIGNVEVGSNGRGTFDIYNEGNKILNVTDINVDNHLFKIDMGQTSIGANSSRTITVTYNPAFQGEENGIITITSDDSDEGSLTVNVRAYGVDYGDWIPGSLDIGDFNVGESGDVNFEITNSWNSELSINNISSDNGNFTVNPSSAVLQPGEKIMVTVTFTPQDSGDQSTNIRVDTNASGYESVDIYVSARGLSPEINVNPTELDLGEVPIGSNSSQTFNIANDGNATLSMSAIESDHKDFTVDMTSFDIGPGDNRTVNVTFSPGEPGNPDGNIRIDSNDIDESTVNIHVFGRVALPEIDVTVTDIYFGNVNVNESNNMSFYIQNNGSATLNVSNISCNNSKFWINQTSMSIEQGNSQEINVSFTPDAIGEETGTITIESDDNDEATVSVGVRGVGMDSEIEVDITSLSIENVRIGETGNEIFTITNSGNAPLSVTDINVNNSSFSVSPGIVVIPPGNNQTISVSFHPTDTNMQQATLSINSNDIDEPTIDISVSGTVIGSIVSISRYDVQFGEVDVGNSLVETFTISNDGDRNLSVSNIYCDNGAFSVTPSNLSIPAGENRTVTVTFSPSWSGEFQASIMIESDEGKFTVSVSGTTQDVGQYLQISSPNSGEKLVPGTIYDITWDHIGISDLRIEFSSDGGNTWKELIQETLISWLFPCSI